MVLRFLNWLDLLGNILVFLFPFLKSTNHFQTTDTGLQISQASKTFGKFYRWYSELLSNFSKISFQENVYEGISHPVFYGDLVYKVRRVKCEANFVSSGSKIVNRLRRRHVDPVIIERRIGLVLGPSTTLYRSFPKRCTPIHKAVGTIWRDLSKPPQTRRDPGTRPLWLLVGAPSVLEPELASRLEEHSLLWWMPLYNFDILFLHVCVVILWPLRLAWLSVLGSS